MTRKLSAAALLWIPALLALPHEAAAQAVEPEGTASESLVVGDIEELDLDEVRRIIDESGSETGETGEFAPLAPSSRRLTLEESVRVALENNLKIQIAEETVNAFAQEVPIAEAKFDPTLGFNLQAGGFRYEDLEGDSHEDNDARRGVAFVEKELVTGGSFRLANETISDNPGDDSRAYDAGLGVEVRQPLLRGGRTYVARREIADAEYDLVIEQARLQSEILNVKADTKAAYYETILAARLIEVTEQAIARNVELLEASEALFKAGRASKRDVLSASISLSQDLARLAGRRADLELARNDLRDVTGLPIGTRIELADEKIRFEPVEIRLADWIRTALGSRPEVLAQRTRIEKNDLEIRVSENDVFPQFDLVGLYRRSQAADSLSRAYQLDSNRWEAGVEFSIPLWNTAAKERLVQAQIRDRRLERELRQIERQIELEVRAVVIELGSRLARLRALTATVEESRALVQVASARYQHGLANNLDITDAQDDLRDAETDMLRAVADYEIGLALLEARIASPL
jgi:outer membrane protein TolC